MTETATKLQVKKETKPAPAAMSWRPLESLRREIEQVFDAFDGDIWRSPFRRSPFEVEPLRRLQAAWKSPAADIVENTTSYTVNAELPGMDAANVEVKTSNGSLIIRGEKKEEKEEKNEDYHLSERRFGSFERLFPIPEGVDESRIEASFKNGVLSVKLPKTAEAQKPEKKIEVKAA